ncbi:MAG: hypothetical protein KatS3mg115_0356 [Candidatus Poribacteria bacterium]|nr:MAG: hypothetical protein KatS3mg115_0356 [Candidatus Poribacteria bacterium]
MSATASLLNRSRWGDFYELTKPRIVFLVVVAAAIGYLAGAQESFSWSALLHLAVGTGLAGAGAGALNQVLERDVDRRMRRTRSRPIPAGRITPLEGGAFGAALAASSIIYLLVTTHPLTALLAALTIGLYLFVYTPSKRYTPLSTVIGAVPGAMPPLGGWAAATGQLSAGGWTLFAILFLWQLPHFLAIAWMFREDYAQAGFPMLPVVDPSGSITDPTGGLRDGDFGPHQPGSFAPGGHGVAVRVRRLCAGGLFLLEQSPNGPEAYCC